MQRTNVGVALSAPPATTSDNASATPKDQPEAGELAVRFDSGFWSNDTMVNVGWLNVRYTIAHRTPGLEHQTPAEVHAAAPAD